LNDPRTIVMLLAYDGTAYGGWQFQANSVSVQQRLEEALARVLGGRSPVLAAGRTDAGVHALGQVASLRTSSPLPIARILGGANFYLPRDIRVLDAVESEAPFHPIRDALRRDYLYRILDRPVHCPLREGRVWHTVRPVDEGLLSRFLALLEGEHDFTSFSRSGEEEEEERGAIRRVRTLFRCRAERFGDEVRVRLAGNAFLRNMVRVIVGTAVELLRVDSPPETMREILEARDRAKAGPTAPPSGLYLERVFYPEESAGELLRRPPAEVCRELA
jgi:tRNA pseudouridine38-40 synthase